MFKFNTMHFHEAIWEGMLVLSFENPFQTSLKQNFEYFFLWAELKLFAVSHASEARHA